MATPETGLDPAARIRAELVALLQGSNAHAGARTILSGIPPERANDRVEGLPHSLWDLVYHLWYSQHDILVFSLSADYKEREWPGDYWPAAPATPESLEDTKQAFLDDLQKLVRLVESGSTDLFAELDHAPGYTLLREVLVAADHNSHHLGQVIALRRMLGLWGE